MAWGLTTPMPCCRSRHAAWRARLMRLFRSGPVLRLAESSAPPPPPPPPPLAPEAAEEAGVAAALQAVSESDFYEPLLQRSERANEELPPYSDGSDEEEGGGGDGTGSPAAPLEPLVHAVPAHWKVHPKVVAAAMEYSMILLCSFALGFSIFVEVRLGQDGRAPCCPSVPSTPALQIWKINVEDNAATRRVFQLVM